MRVISSLWFVLLVLSASGCWENQVVNPELQRDVMITSVSLSATLPIPTARPAAPPASTDAAVPFADEVGSSSSHVALKFAEGMPATFRVVSLRLLSADDASEVMDLSASNPVEWEGNAFRAWDETLPEGEISVQYTLQPSQ